MTLELLRSVDYQIELKECVLVDAYDSLWTLLVFQMQNLSLLMSIIKPSFKNTGFNKLCLSYCRATQAKHQG